MAHVDRSEIRSHMEVVGSDDQHVGRVDRVEADGTLKLTRTDREAGGRHHFVPMDWVSEIEGDRVKLSLPGDEAQRQWRAEG